MSSKNSTGKHGNKMTDASLAKIVGGKASVSLASSGAPRASTKASTSRSMPTKSSSVSSAASKKPSTQK
ncbi:MAG: hypothetical protein EXS00_06310 [Phycisphaerales bacterium]|nr:hypothetical protein [Phycisphaerales bacterium]